MADRRTSGLWTPRSGSVAIPRRKLLRGGAGVLGGVALTALVGCTQKSSAATAPPAAPSAATPAAAAATAAPTAAATATQAAAAKTAGAMESTDTYLTILTDAMIGRGDGWPGYVPAFFRIPHHARVTVHVMNFDDADDMSDASLIQYTEVAGTVDTMVIVQPMTDGDPNKLGKSIVSQQLDPKNGVSHTFTCEQLYLNVPIAPKAMTTFTIETGDPGLYHWECHVPCGGDPNGLGAAMITPGYMTGTFTVV